VFTRAIVAGLRSGEADLDHDGAVTPDELYDYVHEKVVAQRPTQRPGKWEWDVRGQVVLARRAGFDDSLPAQLQQAVASPFVGTRLGAVEDLEALYRAPGSPLAQRAQDALRRLQDDDSRRVAERASAALAPAHGGAPVPADDQAPATPEDSAPPIVSPWARPVGIVAATVLVLLAATIAAVLLRPSRATTAAPLSAEPLLSRVTVPGGYQIDVTVPTTGQRTHLTDPGAFRLPQWSNDRRQVAFIKQVGPRWQARTVPADGSRAPTLVTSQLARSRVTWSPDDQQLAYSGTGVGGNRDLFLVSIDGKNTRHLTSGPSAEDDPAFSNAGDQIAFWTDRSGSRQIWLLHPDKPNAPWRELTSGPDDRVDPAWSPDDTHVAYTQVSPDGGSHIWVINTDRSNAHALTSGPAIDMDPTWAPDGSWIAFDRGPMTHRTIWAVRPDGTGLRQVTPGGTAEDQPSW